jgi:hypothetical protein
MRKNRLYAAVTRVTAIVVLSLIGIAAQSGSVRGQGTELRPRPDLPASRELAGKPWMEQKLQSFGCARYIQGVVDTTNFYTKAGRPKAFCPPESATVVGNAPIASRFLTAHPEYGTRPVAELVFRH